LFLKKEVVPEREFVVIPSHDVDERLDVFLCGRLAGMSRAQVQRLIEEGMVRVDGFKKKSSYRLRENERVEVSYSHPQKEDVGPEDLPLDVIHIDDHMIVIDKPSGMIVHPGARQKSRTLVNALLFHFPDVAKVGPEDKPGIVHRLDKETSGVILVARTPQSYVELQKQFKARQVEKLYLGLVWGKVPQTEGEISWAIGRHVKHGGRMSVKSRKLRAAETHFAVKKRFKDLTLLEIRPVTGRTHQIRVHLSASGYPIVGDPRYGRRKLKIKSSRLFLHALKITVNHPHSGERVQFVAPVPADLRSFLAKLEETDQGESPSI
jgi:23S rRNA pseudouridine1911/1915/1917 synthase